MAMAVNVAVSLNVVAAVNVAEAGILVRHRPQPSGAAVRDML